MVHFPQGWEGPVTAAVEEELCDVKKVAVRMAAEPAVADYSDEVTDEHLERIKILVPKEEFEDAEEVDEDKSVEINPAETGFLPARRPSSG